MKFINILAGITIIGLIPVSCNEKYNTGELKNAQIISARGNSWITNDVSLNGEMITQEGIRNWKDESTEIKTWFRTEKAGRVKIGMRARTINGKSAIICTLDDKSETVKISNQAFDTIMIGEFSVRPGYNALVLKGSSKADSVYAEVNDFFLTGEAVDGKTWFVKDDFYWGRRGPSVHLRYNVPAEAGNIKWFYNEITVPEGNDVSGSYFMADGFTDGYFGMQVNSETERRILFSVWSPYKTDNPGEIPEDQKIILLGKGEGVYTGEFGNEGSGGQSYYRYMWKAGNTYSFLLKGEPAVNNSTDYTAWFLAPETGEWKLIASFRRPQGSRYLGNLYSFLENFSTETGCITRSGYYSNQWVCNESGVWSELTDVKFTADATARKESRMDYSGGVENGRFFLKNCGFFSETTEMNTGFSRRATGTRPEIDLATFKTPASK